jgi:hypothetical protein
MRAGATMTILIGVASFLFTFAALHTYRNRGWRRVSRAMKANFGGK